MRLLVYDMPKAKEECLFYREKVWTADCTFCREYCILLQDSCDLQVKQKWPICCSGLDEVRK
jgi:hypothetical protein